MGTCVSWRRIAIVALMAGLGGLAGTAAALWATTRVVYTGATLAGKSMRIDTVVVSKAADQQKPDQFVISIVGTGQATSADSQFYALVKAIHGGKLCQIGTDSLMLRPDPQVSGAQMGEVRLVNWVADSLWVRSRNPRSTQVTGAALQVTAVRLP